MNDAAIGRSEKKESKGKREKRGTRKKEIGLGDF